MKDISPDARKPGLLRWVVVAVPYFWLALFFLAPFFIVVKISFSTSAISMPPYTPTFDLSAGWAAFWASASQFTLDSYAYLFTEPLYITAVVSSVRIALVSTILLLITGYPIAYAMSRASNSLRPTLVMMIILPFWTSFLIRVYAWIGILKPEGLLTLLLQTLHILGPDQQVEIMNTETAVFIGIVYSYLPFMVLPLYSALEKLDDTLLEAASDLGCTPLKSFWVVTVPLSLPGILAGSFLCFIPIMGEFVIPDLLGGPDTLMIGHQLWNEFFSNHDWPTASAVAVVLLLVLVVPIALFQNQQSKA